MWHPSISEEIQLPLQKFLQKIEKHCKCLSGFFKDSSGFSFSEKNTLGLGCSNCCVFFSAVMAGRTELRWWRDMNRRLWAASLWSCTLKRSPPSTTTSWSSGSAPTPATRGSLSSGSTGFSAAFPDTPRRTRTMHETAQVPKNLSGNYDVSCSLFIYLFFWFTFLRQCAHQLVFLKCSDVCNAQRTMPKDPVNWNTFFNYELDARG